MYKQSITPRKGVFMLLSVIAILIVISSVIGHLSQKKKNLSMMAFPTQVMSTFWEAICYSHLQLPTKGKAASHILSDVMSLLN